MGNKCKSTKPHGGSHHEEHGVGITYQQPQQYSNMPNPSGTSSVSAQTNYNQQLTKKKTFKQLNFDCEFFNQSQGVNQALNQDLIDNPKEKIEIFISFIVDNENSVFELNQAQTEIKLIISLKTKGNDNYRLLGSTQPIVVNDKVTQFSNSFVFDYFFEVQQILKVEIFVNNTSQGFLEFVVGKIMSARGQRLDMPFQINSRGTLAQSKIRFAGVPVKSGDFEVIMDFTSLLLFSNGQPINPYFYIKKYINPTTVNIKDSENWVRVYKSEILTGNQYPKVFKKLQIQVQYLNNNDFSKPIQIDFCHYNNGEEVYLGSLTDCLEGFVNFREMDLDLNLNIALSNKLIKFYVRNVKKHKFLDYLRGGLEITTILGIDFTISNEEPYKEISLHTLCDSPNLYEKAILSCMKIIEHYNKDQMYPTFGFGAKFGGVVNHCFNLNQKNDPNIYGIEGILDCYRNFLCEVKLWTPTHFSPIINRTNQIVKSKNNKEMYFILLILTDGIINDLDETKDAIVEASNLPISIIIIGIGPGGENGFKEMDILDADVNPLFNSKNVQASRDLVQFVEFNKCMNEMNLLAANVLEEVPRQVEEYYKMIKKPPNDPIKDFEGNSYP